MDVVKELWRFPVKSMQGERVDDVVLTAQGILGDRACALVDAETGKVASAKSVKRFPGLLHCRARFVAPPRPGEALPPVRIDLPDGAVVDSDAGDADRVLSAYFRRDVRLAWVAPDDFTIDMYHADVEGAAPAGSGGTVVEQKLGAALFAAFGMPSPLPRGVFLDAFPLSLITASTLARLHELAPGSRFDARRFRMNIVVGSEESGFVENDWVGREIGIGDGARIRVAMPDGRCVMTLLAQGDLPEDSDVLRTLVRHNTVVVDGLGPMACAGVYAVVAAPGTLRVGDRVAAITPM